MSIDNYFITSFGEVENFNLRRSVYDFFLKPYISYYYIDSGINLFPIQDGSNKGMASSSPPPSNEWVKGKLVGSGSFGSVHLAMNKSTGGLFVVKSARGRSECELLALENEVKILKSLRASPYVVQCLGTDEDECGNVKNVLMEHMGGGSLADVAVNFGGALDEEVVRVYTREILRGLQHVHEQGIVHCDLKCKNVLLGSAGNIKLADFGCAKKVMDNKSRCVGGTPLWMAPEVLRMNNNNSFNDDESSWSTVDVAADIWSLGCTIIEMATGRPPWAEELMTSSSPMAVMLKIAHGGDDAIPQFPSHFSMEGLDFLAKCFHRDPKKRCTANQLLSHPFVISTSCCSASSPHQYASSPMSVLEQIQGFEDDDYDDDELLEEGTTKILWQHGLEDHDNIATTNTALLGSSSGGGHWITVRSSG